jgi:pSer/pThr/pTyr-binding forkhead associated (FHA) protein/ribosomal protein L40E
MTVQAGIVCGKCDCLNPAKNRECLSCGNDLSLESSEPAKSISTLPTDDAATEGKEETPMEQARHYVCTSCYSPVPSGHKFCGKCGTSLNENEAKSSGYFGDLQSPGKAKLILIKGEGVDGMSYHLNSTQHVAGRTDGPIVFSEDHWLSPTHANFIYENGKLVVLDQNSLNGVFVSVKHPLAVRPGTVFMAGEQVFRVETVATLDDSPEADGTFFFSSPHQNSTFRVVQILDGGGDGMVVNARDTEVVIGRENSDMNFPNDPFISGNHTKVGFADGVLSIVDQQSKNGTFVKIDREKELSHGDYLFLGRQLLRVEITE